MLCSISTSTPASNSKSDTNWLDRLHSSRGFSVPAHLHLDHFLSPNPCANPNPSTTFPPPLEKEASDSPQEVSTNPRRRKKHLPPPLDDVAPDEKKQLFDLMGGVLAELFVMGGPPVVREFKEKGARKQSNPRVCVPSVSASIDGCRVPLVTSPPSSADNSVAEAKKSRTKLRRKRGTAAGPVDLDLSAYSRTDVTVIDTSCSGWKSEKVIFRKGVMWKVRDKKVWTLSRKKRRLGLVGRLANEKDKEQPHAESKVPAGEELLASLVEGSAPLDKNDAPEKICHQISNSIRQKISRSPRIHSAKDSTFHRNAATNQKNGISGPKASAKGR
ncbi:neural Wiskott-Aldrich syndrome protein isoform X1 [Canna indica]|uniref:Neural Wiskott-Aldrich syndrome protein isoform X1 n=1 Tax=Canna indica TaxID=4628 RepID=A0AAQ3QCT3_9LILI|nr:neural Wiskott-Aldrich syndrome protein isoform X1 [Canna indica]